MNAKNNDIETRKKLDRAIEDGNMEEIKNIMESIPDCEPEIDVREFTAKIKNKCAGEVNTMKKRISVKAAAVVAAVVAVTGVSVGAATLLQQFTFMKDDNYVTVTSNGELSKEEAEKLADDAVNENAVPDDTNTAKMDVFETVEDAEKEYDMDVIMPDKMHELKLSEVTGTKMYAGENSSVSTIWATYGDTNEKAFALTVTRNDFSDADDVTHISGSDAEGAGDKFVSEQGYTFDKLSDTDEESGKTAEIMTANVGQYEYAMVFLGFDESEMEDIVNSVDLSEYAK